MTTQETRRTTYPAIGIAAGLAVVWGVAAIVRPTATFHLAPILIVSTPLLTSTKEPRVGVAMAGGAALIALTTALLLAGADLMRGPSLLPFGGALTEALVFGLAGTAAVLLLARVGPRRSL